jgi:adenylate cyclase, class 2
LIEQEVKLAFDTDEAARRSIQATGARLVVSRRLLDDYLFDTADARLRASGCTLRLRRDGTHGLITFKGPSRPGPVKSREEIESTVADPAATQAILHALGYRPIFRGQKYREESVLDDAHLCLDETPMGVFVEIEGTPDTIARVAALLGRTTTDYELASYPSLYRRWCEARGRVPGDMLFGNEAMGL